MPKDDELCDIIQSIARQNSIGAKIHPCLTPDKVAKDADVFPPIRTLAMVNLCRSSISWIRKGGAFLAARAFYRASRSTESKAALMSMNAV